MQDVKIKQRKRKRNMSLYYGTVLFIALIIFAILSVTVFFKIETAVVVGSSIYSAEEIIAASGLSGGDNMIRKNMGKASERITSELIYIDTAKIKRKLPSSVEITVTPCVETACMQNEDGYLIISASGKILRAAEQPPEEILIFYGANPAENMEIGAAFASEEENKTEVIYELLSQANAGGFISRITSFDVTDRVNISCLYDNRIEIELGVVSDIEYKFKLADEIISTRLSSDAEGRLRMLESGAQFISKTDLEQIRENRQKIMEMTVPAENSETSPEDVSASTKLNFE